MTDIIANAKQLLDGATPGPWEWVGYDLEQTFDAGGAIVMDVTCENPHLGGIVSVEITPEDERLIAAAPEHAEIIADMEYEYACQRLLPGTPEDWYTWLTTYSLESANGQIREHAERLRARGYEPQSYRIRCRLVGDWEVINE